MIARGAKLLEGSKVAARELEAVRRRVQEIRAEGGTLTLASFRAGESRDIELYARALDRLLTSLGVDHVQSVSPGDVSEAELSAKVRTQNDDPLVNGVLVFAPLPAHIHLNAVLSAVRTIKDVEGRRVFTGFGERVVSPTANAVLALIEESGVDVAGKEAVVIGHSDVVGKPTAILLLDRMATVTVCHVRTQDLRAHVERADIVVAAAGKAGLVKGAWVKPGAVVIDVGENFVGGKLVGDVEFEAARERAGFLSPVPGGVGPVTNVMLVRNLLKLRELQEAQHGDR